MWKNSKVDIALCHEIFNLVDEVLEKLIESLTNRDAHQDVIMIDTSSGIKTSEDPEVKKIKKAVMIMSKFLRVAIVFATNIQYFNSYEVSVQFILKYLENLNSVQLFQEPS